MTTLARAHAGVHLGTVLGVWAHPDDEAYLSARLMAAALRGAHRADAPDVAMWASGAEDAPMAVQLNHHIVHARDPQASATFLTELLGLPAPTRFSHFTVVTTANGVSLDYTQTDDPTYLVPNHYAFLVTEDEFDEIFGRIQARGLTFWADPGRQAEGIVNRHDGGRGVYWQDPDGHLLEIITRPYGSGEG